MTTLQEAAMRKALELGKRYAKCLMMNQAPFDEAIESLRTALAQQGDPVAWRHNCNALCTDGLELWIDHCPHCGKPRTTHAEQWPPGLITDIVLTVTALHKEVDIGWSPDARSHLSRLSTSIGMLAAAPSPQPAHECTRSHPHERMDMCCELRTEIARLTNENARLKAAPQPAQEQVGINGLTEAETSASMSVLGLSKPAQGNAELIARSTKVAAELDDFNSSLDRKAAKCIRELLTALQSAQPVSANIQTKIVKDISAHEGGKQQLPPLPTTELAARASGL